MPYAGPLVCCPALPAAQAPPCTVLLPGGPRPHTAVARPPSSGALTSPLGGKRAGQRPARPASIDVASSAPTHPTAPRGPALREGAQGAQVRTHTRQHGHDVQHMAHAGADRQIPAAQAPPCTVLLPGGPRPHTPTHHAYKMGSATAGRRREGRAGWGTPHHPPFTPHHSCCFRMLD
jgi:hypothetical protein